MLVGALLAAGAMEHALVTHDFTLVFVAENNSTVTPLLYSITGMWSALAGSILLWGLDPLAGSTIFVWRYRRQAEDPVIRYATLVLYVVSAFFFGLMVGPANPFVTAAGRDAGARAQLAAPGQPAGGDPPAAPLRRLRRLHRPLRLRHRHAGHGPGGGPLADRVPALDAGRVHLPLRRHRARRLVVVPGARMGRLLGLGPGRERGAPALALRDGLPALGAGPGAARPHAGVEPLPVDRHVRPDHPRHLPHPVRGHQLGPRLLGVLPRTRCSSGSSSRWSSWGSG